MSNASSIEDRIKQILAARLQIGVDVLAKSGAETSLLGRGIGLDSMEALALANAIEAEFDLEIADDDLTRELFATIGSVAAYVLGALAGRS